MDKHSLLTSINDALRSDWTRSELTQGKRIEIPWNVRHLIGEVRSAYEYKGWHIVTNVILTGRDRAAVLSFTNPRWSLESHGLF
jgi:hypothetical protein